MTERVAEALKQVGIVELNKGRVAKRIMDHLAKSKISDLPITTIENFKKVTAAINGIVGSWRGK